MDLGLSGKTVFITGATSGIGEQTAYRFASEGAHVIITGRRRQEGEHVAQAIAKKGVQGRFIQMDVTDRAAIREGFAALGEQGQIDVLIANAGREQANTLPIESLDDDEMDAMIDTNLKGAWLTAKYGIPKLKKPGASIILLSTEWTFLGGSGLSAYTASKTGVNGLTRQLAVEQGPAGVRVNCISPGPIETPMLDRFTQNADMSAFYESNIPLQRAGLADEVSDALLFLGSDRSAYVSGQVIAVDGGMTIKMPTAGLS